MSTERDITRVVRSWLARTSTNPRTEFLDAVLDLLDTTPQRRSTWWPARRFPEMSNTAKLALGGVAVVVVALLGISFLLPGSDLGWRHGPTTPHTHGKSNLARRGQRWCARRGHLRLDSLPANRCASPSRSRGARVREDPSDVRRTFTFRRFAGERTSSDLRPMAWHHHGFCQIDGLYSDPCFASGAGDMRWEPRSTTSPTRLPSRPLYEASAPVDVGLARLLGQALDLTCRRTAANVRPYGLFPWQGSPRTRKGPGNIDGTCGSSMWTAARSWSRSMDYPEGTRSR